LTYTKVGKITHYFDKIQVAVLEVTDGDLKVGDPIRIGEEGTELDQQVESMQVDHTQVTEAKKGSEVGLKVIDKVRPGDLVYLVK
jgi:translation initiation factor IF-2